MEALDSLIFHDVGAAEEFKTAGKRRVQLGAREIVVIWHGGQFFAFKDQCPHYGLPLATGRVETIDGEPSVICREHGWTFTLAAGRCLWPDHAIEEGCTLRLYAVRETPAGRLEIGV